MTTNPLFRFFAVLWSGRAWLETLYLLLGFPLGLAYFVFLMVGWSLGIGTLIIWIGFAVLTLTILLSRAAIELERLQSAVLLGTVLPPAQPEGPREESAWRWLVATMSSPVTWKGTFFLGLRFPLGLVSFIAIVTGLSLSFALIAAPFMSLWALEMDHSSLVVTPTLPWSIVWSVFGLLLLTSTLWLFRGLAALHRWLAQALLVGGAPVFGGAHQRAPVAPSMAASAAA